jgi:D-alanyl-D-alanine carboxypeptidase
MTKAMKDNAVPGIVILVQSPKGDWSTVLGTSEIGTKKPWTLDDHFRIGSNTKTMTGTVILQLAQEGKLALTDPVSKYIPGVPNGDKITIANLAEMRSGLYSYTSDTRFNQTLDKEPKKAWTPAELLRIAFSHPVNAAPDTEFE